MKEKGRRPKPVHVPLIYPSNKKIVEPWLSWKPLYPELSIESFALTTIAVSVAHATVTAEPYNFTERMLLSINSWSINGLTASCINTTESDP